MPKRRAEQECENKNEKRQNATVLNSLWSTLTAAILDMSCDVLGIIYEASLAAWCVSANVSCFDVSMRKRHDRPLSCWRNTRIYLHFISH